MRCFAGILYLWLTRTDATDKPTESRECSCDLDEWKAPPPESKRFEYKRGCDFDVWDQWPSQAEFDDKYWNKAPVMIRGGAFHWPSTLRWSKRALYDSLAKTNNTVEHFQTDDHWASHDVVGTHQYKPLDLTEFLCHHVCKPQFGSEGQDQRYVFDRDDFFNVQNRHDDVPIPPLLASHYDPEWHARWSRYFLSSAFGSGINFHAHTNAFNGLVYGRKRWFIYPKGPAPPEFKVGPVQWFETVYHPSWASSAAGAGKDGLLQCMQQSGDVLYVPQSWWHATIALGEGIGTSGQFVRRTNDILEDATKFAAQKEYDKAAKAYQLVIKHEDEVEDGIIVAVINNLGIMKLYLGDLDAAEAAARRAMSHKASNDNDRDKANLILNECSKARNARGPSKSRKAKRPSKRREL